MSVVPGPRTFKLFAFVLLGCAAYFFVGAVHGFVDDDLLWGAFYLALGVAAVAQGLYFIGKDRQLARSTKPDNDAEQDD